MRYIVWLLLFTVTGSYAQTALPSLGTYADQFYYIENLRSFLNNNKRCWSTDTVDKLAQQANEAGDLTLYGELKLLKVKNVAMQQKVYDVAIEKQFDSLLNFAKDNNLAYLVTDVLQAAAVYQWAFNKKGIAMENYQNAYAIYHNFSGKEFPPKQNYVYTLAGTYYGYEDYDNTLKYLREAITTPAVKDDVLYYTIDNTIGLCYRNRQQYDSALWYFQQVYDSSKAPNGRHVWTSIAGGNIGITYFYQGKYAEAIPLLDSDISISLATKQIKNAVSSMTIRAAVYYQLKDYKNAEKTLLEGLRISENKPFWPNYPMAFKIYRLLSQVYAAQHNIVKAYAYADSALNAKDSADVRFNALTLTKTNEKLDMVQHKLDAQKLDNQVKLTELQLSKKRIETIFFLIGVAILLFVIWFIMKERKRSENLLLNILPEKIAERLKKREHPIADYFDNASILFIDMAGFTIFSDGKDPKEVVTLLNNIFTQFDILAEKYGLEKIKTIGDCYMAVSGLPESRHDHAEAATLMALEVRKEMKEYKTKDGHPIQFRMGLDCGPVVAGVIGRRKFIYDLWGDAVNTASRMETTGVAGEIHCSDRFKKKIEHKHQFTSRGTIEIKGKGMMETWLIIS